jgi:hypothetical protein
MSYRAGEQLIFRATLWHCDLHHPAQLWISPKEDQLYLTVESASGLIIATDVPTSSMIATTEDAPMKGETVLLRVVDGTWEGWKWMRFDEFLRQVNIGTWKAEQALVGMVLPPARDEPVH